MDNKFQKIWKKFKFIKQMLRLKHKNIDNHSNNSRNHVATYYQTLEEVPGAGRIKKFKKFEKLQIFIFLKIS